MNTPYPDRYMQQVLREADERRREAEQLQADFDERVRVALDRYTHDPVFHAEVYQVARVIDNDDDFARLFDEEGPDSAWEMALGLALKAVVAVHEQRPGGLLHIEGMQ
jgi:hypothetical protein